LKYAPYLTNRALCYSRLNNAEKVLKDALASIEADSNWVKGYYYKGKTLKMLNCKQEAIDCYRKCCQMNPQQKIYEQVLKECLGENATSSNLTTSTTNNDEVVHYGVKCDVCNCCPIVGIRYKCSQYSNYDLCSKCLPSNPNQKNHKETHALIPHKQSMVQPTSTSALG
ncbi:unnamed protein product, partial [Didymodactylos carnosus]